MAKFNAIIVGAGEINFGSPEGPWNHTARLERLLGDSLNVLSLVDPDLERSKARLAEKRAVRMPPSIPRAWASTLVHLSLEQAASELGPNVAVDLIVLGCPPHFRGSLAPGKDSDLQMLQLFPQSRGFLIEKPIAAVNPFESDCHQVAQSFQAWQQRGKVTGAPRVVSVGYMLRYNKAITKLRQLMAENHLVPTAISARYYMAYEHAVKLSWWNKQVSCGPVVEQATHFVDLIRFLAGTADNEALLDSVRATSLDHDKEAGRLAKLGFDESVVPPEDRVPRITSAFWRHRRGTIASLTHAITLHGNKYDTELEVLADGWIFRVRDAYEPITTLSVKGPGVEGEQVFKIQDDPFFSEFETLIRAIRAQPSSQDCEDCEGEKQRLQEGTSSNSTRKAPVIAPPLPLSDYSEALKTYELTWRIRLAAEESKASSLGALGTRQH
ncbi:hypothetical protein IE53DRAFT_382047 [Violaceomyces palustris]|uniref:Uncharacterized protein n=1 Tax=Violaceomyces palustris TaxID=1673888 RepID=A0ACD0NP42_9BASI|nr:hypothetical protein IE53DRAFT_382047 [Violaceomyces palustris]